MTAIGESIEATVLGAVAAAVAAACMLAIYPLGVHGLVAACVAAVVVVAAASDLERRVIPNRVVVPATVVVAAVGITAAPGAAAELLLAAAVGFAAFAIPNLINPRLVGMGDAKLAMFLGAGLGWGVVGAIALAFVAIFPFALRTLICGGRSAGQTTLPFGPFLAVGAIVILIAARLASGGA